VDSGGRAAIEPERASGTHLKGESPKRKQNAERKANYIKLRRQKNCPQTEGEGGDVAYRDHALEPCPAVARDVRNWSACIHRVKNRWQMEKNM
jgi:hypothetical protein